MTEPSQYFKGRTVQEQMNEVIGYVDVRAEEVAAAKADDVLEPAEQAKDDAIAAKEAAEQARDTTLAALPQIHQDIADLKAEDVSLDGRLDTVELKIQTAEGNIVTIQGQIVALQTADGQNVKINRINDYAVGLTGNQKWTGEKRANSTFSHGITNTDMMLNPETNVGMLVESYVDKMDADTHNLLGGITRVRNSAGENYLDIQTTSYGVFEDNVQKKVDVFIRLAINDNNKIASLTFFRIKSNADGSGTPEVSSKTLASITIDGDIS